MADIIHITTFASVPRFYAARERAASRADKTGDDAEFELASDRSLAAIEAVQAHGTAADKTKLRAFLFRRYGAIAIGVALLAGSAHAGDQPSTTWPRNGDVTHCDGVLTSNDVCIGSENTVDDPDDHAAIEVQTIVIRPDRDSDRRHDRDQDDD